MYITRQITLDTATPQLFVRWNTGKLGVELIVAAERQAGDPGPAIIIARHELEGAYLSKLAEEWLTLHDFGSTDLSLARQTVAKYQPEAADDDVSELDAQLGGENLDW